jgi:hypothetical protein
MGRTLRSDRGPANGWNRRYLAVGGGRDEGPESTQNGRSVARFGSFHLTGEARQTETWDRKAERRNGAGHRLDRWGRSAGRPRQTIGQAQLGWFRSNSALSSPNQRLTKAE